MALLAACCLLVATGTAAQDHTDAGVRVRGTTGPGSGDAGSAGSISGAGADGGAPVEGVRHLVPPQLVTSPEITLPEGAAPLPEDATVGLGLVIDADGHVTDAQILVPLRDDVDARVLEAARQMRFEPARRDGVAIPSRVRFQFHVSPPAAAPSRGGGGVAASATTTTSTSTSTTSTSTSTTSTSTTSTTPTSTTPTSTTPAPPLAFGATATVDRPEPGAASRIVLHAQELTTVPGTFGYPLRVVQALPGVARSPYSLGFFAVRGASFENTGFLVDGYYVPILYHLGAGPAVISARLVDQLRFYPGGYPVEYGRFTAGIIAVDTAPPHVEAPHFELEVDLLRASALGIVPFDHGRGTVAVAYRRSYYELLLPLLVKGVNLSYQDWQVRADEKISDRLSASVFVFGSDDNLDTSQAAGAGVTSDTTQTGITYGFIRAIAGLTLKLSHHGRLRWSGSIGHDASDSARPRRARAPSGRSSRPSPSARASS